MFHQHENLQTSIRKKKARIEEINLILAQPIPKGATSGSRRTLIEKRLHLEEAIAELEAEKLRLISLAKPNALKLPIDLAASGDPVGTNPFSMSDLRHTVWQDATHRAEEELDRFNSQLLKTRMADPATAMNFMLRMVTGKFDIWARRSVSVVWSDGAVHDYDHWLISYAEAWLRDVGAAESWGIVLPRDLLLSELQLSLMERVEWWKAEARRYFREQKDHIVSKENVLVKADGSKSADGTVHLDASADYRSVRFRGRRYTLTRNQSEIVKVLDQAFRVGHPDVGKDKLLSAIGSETSEVRDSFRKSPLWKTLVVSPRSGVYRLNLK